MPPNVVTEASLGTRVSQWWSGIPCITSATVLLCSAIYVIDLLVGYDTFHEVCFSPAFVIRDWQVYRLLVAVVFHASLMHVVFNMLALVPIGSSLERIMGSVRYLHLLLITCVSNALIHVAIAYIIAYNPLYASKEFVRECQIGFSGLLFAMIVIESSLYTGQSRSIFGFFNVPSKWYPWVLLLIFQLLMPRVSLLGHLSGILSGFAYTGGLMNFLLFSQATYSKIESSWLCAFCIRRPTFIVGGGSAASTSPSTGNNVSLSDAWRQIRSSMQPRAQAPPSADQRFPGQPRTLGGGGRTSQHSTPDSTRDLEARLLDDEDLELVEAPPVSTGGAGAPPPARHPQPARSNQQADKDAALGSLVAMGYEESHAKVALTAADWDITSAVEILSSQAR